MNHEKHNLFKPKSLQEGKHAVVGDCNGFTMEERWNLETPLFAEAICRHVPEGGRVLDYGCGVGRIAKEVIKRRPDVKLVVTDASTAMLEEAKKYINSSLVIYFNPEDICSHIETGFDVIYCIYVLQHCPAIELRDVLQRMYQTIKFNTGKLIYCSSNYRMAIRYDGNGFFDDRFLGVDLQKEVSRFFIHKEELFNKEEYESNQILRHMILGDGGLEHPAGVYTAKNNGTAKYFDFKESEVEKQEFFDNTKKHDEGIHYGPEEFSTNRILLVNRLAPGDILVMTNAIRDLKMANPDLEIDVRTPANEIFDNNPHITKLKYSERDFSLVNKWFQKNDASKMDRAHRVAIIKQEESIGRGANIAVIDMHYPEIHKSGTSGKHFSEGHRKFLSDILGMAIEQKEIRPEIYLKKEEIMWPSPVLVKEGLDEKYWVINAGSKGDYTLKQYPWYQEVVDKFKRTKLVQIGQKGHNHKPLDGVVDMVGKTDLRELFRLIYHAEGVVTCVSLPMHIAAAFSKPCVVIAGGREPWRWEAYPNHYYIYRNGMIWCAPHDGCWKSKHGDCVNMTDNNIPQCMRMITSDDVIRGMNMYYEGGMLKEGEE